MSDRIKKIKIKQADGTMSGYYPIGADAQNIDFNNGFNLDNIVGSINPDESGSIATQLSKSIKYYDCVADMKADTTLNGGGAARTLGYYEPGDGGGAIYRIVKTSSDLTVALNNGLYAELNIDNGIINVKQMGLKDTSLSQDCHEDLQVLLDLVANTSYILYFPNNYEFKIASPLILRHNKAYRIMGNHNRTAERNLFINCYQGFIGENYPNNWTTVIMEMRDMMIQCTTSSITTTLFKGICFSSSYFYDNLFYHPWVFLEGALQAGTYFERNRVQSIRFALMMDICITQDSYNFDTYKEAITAAGGSLENIDNIMNKTHSAADSFIRYNYIAGQGTSSTNTTSVFITYNGLDTDVDINNNWFEFFCYIIRPVFRSTIEHVYGNKFTSNMFQYIFRFFESGNRYSGWYFNNNDFTSMNATDLKKKMNNSELFDNNECGIIISVADDIYKSQFKNIYFLNNRLYNVNMAIDIVTTGTSHELSLVENNTTNIGSYSAGSRSKINVSYYSQHDANAKGFYRTYLGSWNNAYLEEMPVIEPSTNHVFNSFAGQIIFVNHIPYIAIDDGVHFKYEPLLNMNTSV